MPDVERLMTVLDFGAEDGPNRDLAGDLARWEADGGATEGAGARASTVRFLEHTGELELELRAPTLAGLFVKAGEILGGFMLDGITSPEPETAHAVVRLEARDRAGLLVVWIDELIYRAETEKVVFTRFEVRSLTEHELDAAVHGVSPAVFRNPVKAATYHRLSLEREAAGSFVANVVLDV